MWLTKDADSKTERDKMIAESKNPDVVKAVLAEVDRAINDAGEKHKKNYEELNKEFHTFKQLVGEKKTELDPLVKAQIDRIGEAITVRQTEMDNDYATTKEAQKAQREEYESKLIKRVDGLELALKRPAGINGDVSESDDVKLAHQFQVQCLALKDEGARWNMVKNLQPNMEVYKGYVENFETFMRQKDSDRTMSADELKQLTVGADPEGGYTVTPAMSTRIISRIYEMDPIRQLAAVETISTGAIEWMVDWGQAGFGWEGETETGDETTTSDFKKKRIPVHVLYAKPRATQVLLEDSGINIENWHANHVGSRFGRAEGAAFVDGDSNGKPRGFLTYDDVTTAGTPEYGKIEQVNMGNATALTADGFKSVKYSLVEDFLNRGTWLMNRLTVAAAMKLKDGNGQYLWQPGMQLGQPASLDGLPVRMSTTMPQVAAGALSICLADWNEFYMVVDRLGITVQRDPYTAKPFIEFYTRKRVGGDVINYDAGRIGVIAA